MAFTKLSTVIISCIHVFTAVTPATSIFTVLDKHTVDIFRVQAAEYSLTACLWRWSHYALSQQWYLHIYQSTQHNIPDTLNLHKYYLLVQKNSWLTLSVSGFLFNSLYGEDHTNNMPFKKSIITSNERNWTATVKSLVNLKIITVYSDNKTNPTNKLCE
jgi:hypothetical protein